MRAEKSEVDLETIVRRIQSGKVNLQPPFQRGDIWDKPRQQRLIDTILRGWYIPAVHIVVDPEGREEVLDGQQRLTAIAAFLEDKFVVDGSIPPHDDKIAELHGLRFTRLPVRVQDVLLNSTLSVVRLRDFNPDEPNELFFRLNQSYNLTPPEKRNALHGPARDQVRDLVGELESTGLLTPVNVGFSNKRLAYDDIVARVCVTIDRSTLRRHINNNTVEDVYRSLQPFRDETVTGLRDAAQTLMLQINSSPERVKFNKGTLQTWLIYCYWARRATGELPAKLLGTFEQERLQLRQNGRSRFPQIQGVVSQYDDRASYRVTDVASVVIRDAAVHLFSEQVFGTPSWRHSDNFLKDAGRSQNAVASNLAEYLDAVSWGEPLLEDVRQ
jgi:hypothetical protein